MKLYGIVTLVMALLQLLGRISYRALKLQFDLDDEQLEALKAEIIEVHGFATDQDGKFLAWKGEITSSLSFSKTLCYLFDKSQELISQNFQKRRLFIM